MSDMTKKGEIVKGFKATDKDMCCRGFKFELGVWYEHDGEIGMCESGFHFCEYPSGPWAYYDDGRLFNCEAEYVIRSVGPGSDIKHVAKKIRLTSEIKIDGNRNTGDMNTGDMNTGNMNTGYMNTGNMNTGNRNTGDRNTGDMNTGYMNTGNGNAGRSHSGFFNIGDATFIVFGKKADRASFPYKLANELSELLSNDTDFDPTPFLSIPNATNTKIKKLHKEHIKLRSIKNGK